MRKLLIAVVILAVLFVAVDRISVAVAENQISDRVTSAYGLSAKPAVTIEGFPFLTQVVAGDYQQINVSTSQIQADGITLRNLTAQFTSVHASLSQVLSHGPADVTASSATGSALIPFSEIRPKLPRGLRLKVSGNSLALSGSVSYQGARFPVSGTVTPRVTGSQLTVVVDLAGGSGSTPAGAYASSVDGAFPVPLSGLPFHLKLTSVKVTPTGLRIGVFARNVLFAQA